MVSFRRGRQNDRFPAKGVRILVTESGGAHPPRLRISYPANSGEVVAFAANELARSLKAMLAEPVAAIADPSVGGCDVRVGARVISGSSDAGVLHAVYQFLERLGARFPVGRAPVLPRIDRSRIDAVAIAPASEPAFSRRAFVSDIMTWQYEKPERFALHLAHDREFIPWMAASGINAFSYIRHERDSRLKIDELLPLYRERGIASEYGGHVLQLLMPRDRFGANPEFFPVGANGQRNPRGNLCVSSEAALALVRDGALRYLSENPECALLHIWGADVWDGAWCRCGDCSRLSPQRQYMKVVNAIAAALAERPVEATPVAYLAYHDTLEPDPGLDPMPNVSFEWAPRERCYSHAIDNPVCAVNPRYLDSLKRYIDMFEGRGHVFEYYADAILFGGLGFATPSIIARDLRAYRALGITSVSCLTFGAYSVLAYPVNLEAFARATHSPDFDPDATLADVAAQIHPQCAPAMTAAYRAIARASALILNGGGDVMRPPLNAPAPAERIGELRESHKILREACAAADEVLADGRDGLTRAERAVWQYGREVVDGVADYLAAAGLIGDERRQRAEAAINQIGEAIVHVRGIELALKGTWGAYDIEWVRDIWLAALRRRFGDYQA
jgi:hypothetical protein